MNFITPIILLILSAGLIFGYVNPTYQGADKADSVVNLQQTQAQYDTALSNSVEIHNKIQSLSDRTNGIQSDDLLKLEKLLPENVDNIRLIVELEDIVKRYSAVGFKVVTVSKTSTDDGSGAIVQPDQKYNTININFTVSMSYDHFIGFLKDLESNLRLADVTGVSFTANDLGTYDFSFSLKTYWLK